MCFNMNTLLYTGIGFCRETDTWGQDWRSIKMGYYLSGNSRAT